MVNTRVIILNAKQIADSIHDYIATYGKDLCHDESLKEAGTCIMLDKNCTKTLCVLSRNNSFVFNKEDLLDRLPHSGLSTFIMSNKQIEKLLVNNRKLSIEDLDFVNEYKHSRISKKHFYLFTLNDMEMKEILFKQMFEIIGMIFGYQMDDYNVGMTIEFNGNDSQLIFYYGTRLLKYDLSKLTESEFSYMDIGYKYIDISDS